MQLSTVLFAVLTAATAASAASSQGNGGGGGGADKSPGGNSTGTEHHHQLSEKAECRHMERMESLVKLAANSTRLAEKTHNNATKIAEIKAKAQKAEATLATLQKNTTLTQACSVIDAAEKTSRECMMMGRIERDVALVANETRLADKFHNNATEIAAFKARVAGEEGKLASLQANTTLTGICSVEKTDSECRMMRRLEKEVKLAGNETALEHKFKNNATEIARFKAKAVKAQARLTVLQSNSTLTSACSELAKTTSSGADGDATTGSSHTTPSSGSGKPNGAVRAVGGASSLITIGLGGIMAVMFAL